MPAAVAVPAIVSGVLGTAGLISSNADQKAAAKNNSNQQAAAEQNAQTAAQAAQAQYNGYAQANPSPFAGASVAKPTAGSYGTNPATASTAGRIIQAAMPAGPAAIPQPKPLQAPPQQQQPPNAAIINALLSAA